MDHDNKVKVNDIDINLQKADILLKKLVMKEKINIKTKQYNDSEMVRMIKNMIEEEVKCY